MEDELNVVILNEAMRRASEYLGKSHEHVRKVDVDMLVYAEDNDTLVLVQVISAFADMPEEDHSMANQLRFERMAMLLVEDYDYETIRFDIISIGVTPSEKKALLRHHKGAFNEIK